MNSTNMFSRFYSRISQAIIRRAYSTPASSTPTPAAKKSESLARDLMALERTYLAWARTSLLCLSLGVAMSEYRHFIPKSAKQQKDEEAPILKQVEKVGGLAVIFSGQVILLKSTVRYFRTAKKLTRGEVYPTNKFGVIVLSALAGAAGAVAVLIIKPEWLNMRRGLQEEEENT